MPTIWILESPDELMLAFAVINSINSKYNCGKIYLGGENWKNVTVRIDAFIKDPNDYKDLFKWFLGILQEIADDFIKEMIKAKKMKEETDVESE
jgi:hypothetical protein